MKPVPSMVDETSNVVVLDDRRPEARIAAALEKSKCAEVEMCVHALKLSRDIERISGAITALADRRQLKRERLEALRQAIDLRHKLNESVEEIYR